MSIKMEFIGVLPLCDLPIYVILKFLQFKVTFVSFPLITLHIYKEFYIFSFQYLLPFSSFFLFIYP